MLRIPKPGDYLNTADVEMIVEAIEQRQKNFPEEPAIMTLTLVMLNIGNRFTELTCIEQEWTGLKADLPKIDGEPRCPNGHPLSKGPSLKLMWVPENYDWVEDDEDGS